MKVTPIFLIVGIIASAAQVNAKIVSNPLVDCESQGRLAAKIMTFKLKGASEEKLTRAMQATADTSPEYEIEANIGMQHIKKAFEIEAPKSRKDHAKFAEKFGVEQAAWCKEKTDIQLPD